MFSVSTYSLDSPIKDTRKKVHGSTIQPVADRKRLHGDSIQERGSIQSDSLKRTEVRSE